MGGGFLSIFGSPASYSQAYRDGFLRGYEEGYQRYECIFTGGRFQDSAVQLLKKA